MVSVGPTSPIVLILIFGTAAGCLVALTRARWLAVKIAAGGFALLLATFGGVVGVNDYYGYYQTWGAAYTDLTGQGVAVHVSAADYERIGPGVTRVLHGSVQQVVITGRLSHLHRTGYVYLPPQYYEPEYRDVRFPVVELIPGTPGHASDWFVVLHINQIADQLIAEHRIGPMI